MTPDILTIEPITLVGLSVQTTVVGHEDTRNLWQSFGPQRRGVPNKLGPEAYSVSIFPSPGIPMPQSPVEKWATVPVSSTDAIPEGLKPLTLPAGLYAHFVYRGPVSTFGATLQQFYGQWLPTSGYTLDHRPFFEILGEKYLGPMNPDSEEDIYIPVRKA
ncbi:MAG TPA: GyrI-like domain-containing protein [Cytophagales bacterium]|nr:GyrI-like domain-containing protein [Cytophagales bacterium]HAA19498.1 GyrI-like domain-containing protein [Cytophagales bacterium]HAP59628.1 GyrI-like domain-containing protein [Cytophagales bacterium]